jgi:hypothetical protein
MTDLTDLQRLAADDNHFTTFYRWQFVQNENLRLESMNSVVSSSGTYAVWKYQFQERFVVPDTISIVFEIDGETITQGYIGLRHLMLEENPDLIAFGEFDPFTSTLEIWWRNEPTNITLVASYEFDFQPGNPSRAAYIQDTMKVNWKEEGF